MTTKTNDSTFTCRADKDLIESFKRIAKDNRSDDDNRKLSVLLKAERKADQLVKARADARRLIDAEKGKQRKARTRRMMILASAVESAIKQDSEVEMLMRQVMKKVNDGDYISDRDNEVVKDTIGALLDTSANAPDYR